MSVLGQRYCWPRNRWRLAEERFGYNSVHYLARISASRTQLPEYVRFKSEIAEIQVRTVLQHAWAEIEHDIQYKSSAVIPVQIRRRFIALAGMLEIADREFQAVQDEDNRLRQRARERISEGDFAEVEITPDALKAFLQKAIGSDDRISAFSYNFLAGILRSLGFTTLRQLEECIAGYDDDQLSRLAYGTRQGQVTRCELMLLAGVGEQYVQRHPWAKEDWFQKRQSHILDNFRENGVVPQASE